MREFILSIEKQIPPDSLYDLKSAARMPSYSENQSSRTVWGGSGLYIFDTTQKAESGGYDAAVSCWSKMLLPIDLVVERLSKRE
ncbi:hypothetical protein [Bacteroides acidifaciens]